MVMLRCAGLWAVLVMVSILGLAQPNRWQQHIQYQMEVSLDTGTHRITGTQRITYTNNSPDTLDRIYFHLYWNAFQPNSSMDVRSRELGTKVIGRNCDGSDRLDWDARVRDRISQLKPHEEGFCRIDQLIYNGQPVEGRHFETIDQFMLAKPILPGQTVQLQTRFTAQVPVQIRRSGRYNAEGVAYSMSQWYPKVVEYDYTGWTPNPYIAREFYGVWGNYEVSITLPKNFKIGASGVLQNAAQIGWGYDKEGTPLKAIATPTRTWKFVANQVHDFVWAADPNYLHTTRPTTNGGPLLHFIYKNDSTKNKLWQANADSVAMCYPFIEKNYGPYPWPVYSF
ncbi:MAG TPA: M1 family peptidase, partial [Phnomibacter sp.]|nr:M1 family peptidase [Phnomibacter sp.]